MFALRSSPSSLVCDLRNTLLPAAEGGFQLSAPRPRRASVRLGFDIYYAGDSGEGDGSGGSAFSPAVSDYAGVFEAGDPARARESMTNFGVARPSGLVEEEEEEQPAAPRDDDDHFGGNDQQRDSEFLAPRAGAGRRGSAAAGGDGAGALYDHDEGGSVAEDDGGGGLEEDFLFEMEGLKDNEQQHQDRGMRAAAAGGGGGRTGDAGWGAAAIAGAAAAAAAAAASSRGAGSRGDRGGSPAAPRIFHGTPPTYAASGAGEGSGKLVAPGGVGGCGSTLRKPRVIAPRGTRCIGGGMYRLRLSTSC